MKNYSHFLSWFDTQEDDMVQLLTNWANINTHTSNYFGINQLSQEISQIFSVLGADIQELEMPLSKTINDRGEEEYFNYAPALSFSKRLESSKKALFVIHLDTVYGTESDFQVVKRVDDVLIGPGVADAKAGIVIILKILEAFERQVMHTGWGWQVIFNTDEEIGSLASGDLLSQTAKDFDLGLVFEPSLPDGKFVAARKGSGNFTMIARGLSAHAGRNPQDGRNAITALAKVAIELDKLNGMKEGLTLNVGQILGGVALNVVPDSALCRFNIRLKSVEDQKFVEDSIQTIMNFIQQKTEVEFTLHGAFTAPPKPFDENTEILFKHFYECGKELGMDLGWSDSGGVCDGNRLAAAGLPTIDTLGGVGGNIHSHNEYLEINSLTQRAKLTFLALLKWIEDSGE